MLFLDGTDLIPAKTGSVPGVLDHDRVTAVTDYRMAGPEVIAEHNISITAIQDHVAGQILADMALSLPAGR